MSGRRRRHVRGRKCWRVGRCLRRGLRRVLSRRRRQRACGWSLSRCLSGIASWRLRGIVRRSGCRNIRRSWRGWARRLHGRRSRRKRCRYRRRIPTRIPTRSLGRIHSRIMRRPSGRKTCRAPRRQTRGVSRRGSYRRCASRARRWCMCGRAGRRTGRTMCGSACGHTCGVQRWGWRVPVMRMEEMQVRHVHVWHFEPPRPHARSGSRRDSRRVLDVPEGTISQSLLRG